MMTNYSVLVAIVFLFALDSESQTTIHDTIGITVDHCYLIASGKNVNNEKHGEWTRSKSCGGFEDSLLVEELWHKGQLLMRRSFDSSASFNEIKYSRWNGCTSEFRVVQNGVLKYVERLPWVFKEKRRYVESYDPSGLLQEKGKEIGKYEWGELGTRIVYRKKGKWIYYDENGSLEKVLIYKKGKVIHKKDFN